MPFLNQVRIRYVYEILKHHNPISGHHWTTKGELRGYEIVGPTGVLSVHTSIAKAEAAQKDWQDFFNKYHPPQ